MAVVTVAGFAAAPSIFRAVAFAATEGGWTAALTAGTAASSAFAATLAATSGGTTATAVLASAVPAADGAGPAMLVASAALAAARIMARAAAFAGTRGGRIAA